MVYKIGHAGAAGYSPANTLSSIKKALELGVDMIEFDVHVCQSGEVVVIHDATVNRTTDGRGKIRNLALSQLKQLKVEGKETIPTLQEVLDIISSKAEVNIEIKVVDAAEPVAKIVNEYVKDKGWAPESFFISSFKVRALQIFRAALPDIKIGILTSNPTRRTLKIAKKLHAYSINAKHTSISESFVQTAHNEGFKVFAFTANEVKDIEHLKAMDVDGIFSDYPDRI